MRRALGLALLFPLTFAHVAVEAQIFVCKDASGRTITSDRPIPECADRSMRELDKHGRTRRDIPPPMTAEEKRQAQLQEEKRKAEEAAADEQRRNDRLLRTRYRSEDDIEVARKRALDIVEDQIKTERAALAATEKQRQKALAEAESYKKRNAVIPKALEQQLDGDAQAIDDSRKKIREREEDIAQINAKFDATLKRFRELAGAATQ